MEENTAQQLCRQLHWLKERNICSSFWQTTAKQGLNVLWADTHFSPLSEINSSTIMIADKTYKLTDNRLTHLFHIHSCALANPSYFLCLLSSSLFSSLAPSAQEDFVSLAEMEDSLLRNLFKGYQKWVRPVQHANDTITVRFGLKISQLVDVVRKQGAAFVKCNLVIFFVLNSTVIVSLRQMGGPQIDMKRAQIWTLFYRFGLEHLHLIGMRLTSSLCIFSYVDRGRAAEGKSIESVWPLKGQSATRCCQSP